eukprot:scaffold77599_cov33-Tisochrysis_lutea.AAC.3
MPLPFHRRWRGVPKGSRNRGPGRVRWVVLDEADQILAGSFKPAVRDKYPIEVILKELKLEAKRAAPQVGATSELQSEDYADDENDGTADLRRARNELRRARTEEARTEARAKLAMARAASWASKQFVLVGATMPNAGTKNIEVRCHPPPAGGRAMDTQGFVGRLPHVLALGRSRIAHSMFQAECILSSWITWTRHSRFHYLNAPLIASFTSRRVFPRLNGSAQAVNIETSQACDKFS